MMKTIVRLALGLCAFVGMGACTDARLTDEEVFEMRVAKLKNGGEYRSDTLTITMASINDSMRAAEICEYFQLDTLVDNDATTWDNALSITKFVVNNIPHNNQTYSLKIGMPLLYGNIPRILSQHSTVGSIAY